MTRVDENKWTRDLTKWVEQHLNICAGMQDLLNNLQNNREAGHYLHAQITKQLYESCNYKITNIELKGENQAWGKYDVDIELLDIELDLKTYIQVWLGQNIFAHGFRRQFTDSDQERIDKGEIVIKNNSMPVDWDKELQPISKKLGQLPDGPGGFVIAASPSTPLVLLPDWYSKLPHNKCLIDLRCQFDDETMRMFGEARIHCGQDFHTQSAKKIIHSLGFTNSHTCTCRKSSDGSYVAYQIICDRNLRPNPVLEDARRYAMELGSKAALERLNDEIRAGKYDDLMR